MKLVGLVLEDKGVLRGHQKVTTEFGEGEITSGSFSPSLGKAIAFARIPKDATEKCQVDIRGKLLSARIVKPPFEKTMSNENPSELKYTKTHEWVRDNGDGTVTIGITEHAQELLGDVVFVELPEVETSLSEEENCGVIESVKAASDMYASFICMKLNDMADLENLLSADDYEAECQE
ncbi:Glycine cleavage system H protein [Nymphon striatum]|nr:Glycine cleavage system H protein [Nymphon striatum]